MFGVLYRLVLYCRGMWYLRVYLVYIRTAKIDIRKEN